MKTIKSVSVFLFVSALMLTSCSSDDSSGGGTPAGLHLKAKIDGQNYSNSEHFDPMAIINSGILMIQSSDNSGNSIQIQVTNYNGEGTYNSGSNNLLNGYINYMKAGATIGQYTTYTSVRGTGQVIITKVTDTEITGTFTATAKENVDGSTASVVITEGSFRAEID